MNDIYQTWAETSDWVALAEAFNTVYAGYSVPITMTPERMQQHVEQYNINLADSPLWLSEGGRPVALALLGVREDRGWVGGFGVAAAHRGQGLGHLLITAVLERARLLGLGTLQLEVLSANLAARRTYERAGFRSRRELAVLERSSEVSRRAAISGAPMEREPVHVLAHGPRLHHEPPCWQRERTSIAALPGLRGLTVGDAEKPDGYLLYCVGDSFIRVIDMAARRSAAALALVDHLTRTYPDHTMRLVNEPRTTPLHSVLLSSGWAELVLQREMFLDITVGRLPSS